MDISAGQSQNILIILSRHSSLIKDRKELPQLIHALQLLATTKTKFNLCSKAIAKANGMLVWTLLL